MSTTTTSATATAAASYTLMNPQTSTGGEDTLNSLRKQLEKEQKERRLAEGKVMLCNVDTARWDKG